MSATVLQQSSILEPKNQVFLENVKTLKRWRQDGTLDTVLDFLKKEA